MSGVAELTRTILARRGALVDGDGDNFDVILEPELARRLERPEWLSLDAAAQPSDASAGREWLGFGTDLFRRIGELVDARFAEIALAEETFRMEKIRGGLRDLIVLNNAVFDESAPELRRVSWLIVWSRHAAISDDRREGLLALWINESNLACDILPADREEWLRAMGVWAEGLGAVSGGEAAPSAPGMALIGGAVETPASGGPPALEPLPAATVLAAAATAAGTVARAAQADYLALSTRRLERDARRVHEYYGSLAAEAGRRATRLESSGRMTPDEREKLKRKIAAIELERQAKIDDLRAHYALRIEVEPIALLRVRAVAPVFPLLLKRRKESRPFPLVFNPIFRRIEAMPCESCGHGDGGRWMCDERLHLLCERCFVACGVCGRRFCRACRATCPKNCGSGAA